MRLRGAGQRRHGRAIRGWKTWRSRDPEALADFAQREKVVLTVVGPEAPLAAGVVDLFRSRGLRIFGPTRAAAQLESSKAFSKALHAAPRHSDRALSNVRRRRRRRMRTSKRKARRSSSRPTAWRPARAWWWRCRCRRRTRAIDAMLDGSTLGVQHNDGGARVVIEEFLAGEEASFIVMVDGEHVLPLATSQDHKRLRDDDEGPNTGGMGAYSPAPVVTPNLHAKVMHEIIKPTVAGMRRDGIAVHRLSVRRPDDRCAGQPQDAGVQHPLGRPRGAADPDALEERSVRRADASHRRRARSAWSWPGTAASRSVS